MRRWQRGGTATINDTATAQPSSRRRNYTQPVSQLARGPPSSYPHRICPTYSHQIYPTYSHQILLLEPTHCRSANSMVKASSRTCPSKGPTGAAELSMQMTARPWMSVPGHTIVPVAQAARSSARWSAGAVLSGAMGPVYERGEAMVSEYARAVRGRSDARRR